MTDYDYERQLPPHLDPKLVPNDFRNGKGRQQTTPRPSLRAVKLKGDALRAAIHNSKRLDWSDIHERFCDLWMESRMVIWRAKHSKAEVKQIDPKTGKEVLTFVSDDRLVLQAIETTRGVLDSLVKLRREMGDDATGIQRWALEKIERGLRDYPEARHALLKELDAEDDAVMQ